MVLQTWESYDGVFCNYFSLGVDAIAASAFHEHRETHPEQFTGRIANQVNPYYSFVAFLCKITCSTYFIAYIERSFKSSIKRIEYNTMALYTREKYDTRLDFFNSCLCNDIETILE